MTIYWDVHLQKRVLALGEGNCWRRAQLKVVTALAPSCCWNECRKPGVDLRYGIRYITTYPFKVNVER